MDNSQPVASSAAPSPPRRISDEEIERRFTYHAPKGSQVDRYAQINTATKELAYLIRDVTPAGREQSLSITKLEEVRMRANQAIATGE